MNWLELKLACDKDAAEALESLLWEVGAVSVTLTDAADEPLFEPGVGETPLWNDIVLTGLFEEGADAHAIQLELWKAHAPAELPALHFSILPDQDWVRSWLVDFKPMRFGQSLWVCPSITDDASWVEQHRELFLAMEQPGQTVLKLDPGLAFGTGTHPTTSLCLQWLDAQALNGQQLVDFGCGSGILGIAALLLGAASVIGVDNDPQALTASADNCCKNALAAERFPLYLPEAFDAVTQAPEMGPFEGVLANILAGTLIELAPRITALVRPNGWLLLSGILHQQGDAVIAAYSPCFTGFEVAAEGDWIRISATRKVNTTDAI
jgi:ribosomal protein L11 methyltransferase